MLSGFRLALPLACGVWLAAGSALAADVKITDEARKHFNAGVALLRDPDGARYEEAYREFKVAYAASPSWKTARKPTAPPTAAGGPARLATSAASASSKRST